MCISDLSASDKSLYTSLKLSKGKALGICSLVPVTSSPPLKVISKKLCGLIGDLMSLLTLEKDEATLPVYNT